MIGVDTNVLLRYVLHDDVQQGRRADLLLAREDDRFLIDDVVLCEAVWVLRSGYGLARDVIAQILDEVLDTARFVFEDRNLLRAAVHAYRSGKGGFADYVIGLRNARAGCDHTVTFDRALKAHPSFTLL